MPVSEALNLSLSDLFKRLSNLFQTAIKHIHNKGGYAPSMLADEEISPLINTTAEAFNSAMSKGIGKRPMPSTMRSMLEQNIFIFSGFKTHAELSAVSALLLDSNGKKKPFYKFAEDVKSINENYNLNYLRAEYNFAMQSARSAAQWAQYEKDGDDFYLQYRTASDERVRESHAMLHNVTLPVSDPFWDKYFPPNGWNCRCTVVQVRKSKYPVSDSQWAIQQGEKATTAINKKGQNKLAIFRFNPGKEQKIFPPRHPYFPKGCGKCDKNMLAYNPKKPMCQACKILGQCAKKNVTMFERFENGGALKIHNWVKKRDSKDFDKLKHAARLMAKKGHEVVILPEINVKNPMYLQIFGENAKQYPNKCPDMIVDGKYFYEHKGFTTDNPNKSALNMISKALKQSSRIIIEEPLESNHNIRDIIEGKIRNGKKVDEVYIAHKTELELVFKKKQG